MRKKSIGAPSLKDLLKPVVPLDTSALTPDRGTYADDNIIRSVCSHDHRVGWLHISDDPDTPYMPHVTNNTFSLDTCYMYSLLDLTTIMCE